MLSPGLQTDLIFAKIFRFFGLVLVFFRWFPPESRENPEFPLDDVAVS